LNRLSINNKTEHEADPKNKQTTVKYYYISSIQSKIPYPLYY